MRVIIEDGLSLKYKAGVGNFTINIREVLKSLEVNVYHKKSPVILQKVKNNIIRRILHVIWLNTFFLLYLIFQKKPVTLICTSFQLPVIKIPKVRYISVIHDLTPYKFPEFFTKSQIFYSKFAIQNTIKMANSIVTVSETIKQEILNQFNLSPNRIKIIYNTSNLDFTNFDKQISESMLEKFRLNSKEYILSVATINRRKNLSSLLKAFHSINAKYPNLKLVLVGSLGNDKMLSFQGNLKNVIFTDYVEDSDLIYLYKNALLYVFPSLYEGFGIPILEAQQSKVPLILSNIPVFKEIAGNGAMFCDPGADRIANAIEKLIDNPDLQDELIKNGTENLKRFNKQVIKRQVSEIIYDY